MDLYGPYSGKKPFPAPYNQYMMKPFGVPWGASALNFMLIRYADVLLMNAEAIIEQGGNLEQARQYINQVRMRANNSIDMSIKPCDINTDLVNYSVGQYPASGWNADYARKALRMERRLELAMEGLRWFDLLRWGNVLEVVNDYYQYEVEFHTYYTGANLRADELYFPIPLEQVENAGDIYK